MEELRIYSEWVETLEQENNMRVLDPDGLRSIIQEGKVNTLISKEEANQYFMLNTVMIIRK